MKDESGAAAPATEPAQVAPAESEPATQVESVPNAEAAPENAETPKDQEQPQELDTEQKRQSRSERYRRKISALSGVIERTETEKQELQKEVEALRKAKASDQPPNPADFQGGDYDPAYIAKLAAHESLKAITARLDEREQKDTQDRQRQSAQSAQKKLDESAEKIRGLVPDFDKTLQAFLEDGGEFSPHVKAALHSSGEKAPLLAYQLAKNPDLADRLNGMSPQEALLEIGELRAKASLPTAKTKSSAPPPLKNPVGGASKSVDLATLAKNDDATAYWIARRQQMKAGAP